MIFILCFCRKHWADNSLVWRFVHQISHDNTIQYVRVLVLKGFLGALPVKLLRDLVNLPMLRMKLVGKLVELRGDFSFGILFLAGRTWEGFCSDSDSSMNATECFILIEFTLLIKEIMITAWLQHRKNYLLRMSVMMLMFLPTCNVIYIENRWK